MSSKLWFGLSIVGGGTSLRAGLLFLGFGFVLMPARSQAQREYLYARFGAAWVKRHHFDNPGKLPKRVGKRASR